MASMDPPPELLADEVAVSVWNRLVPDLAKGGLATSVDWPILVRYCLKFSRWLFLGTEIKRILTENPGSRGTTYPIVGENGKVKFVAEFPWSAEWRTLDRELRIDERLFGMSPSARSRLIVPKTATSQANAADPRRAFFNRSAG